MAQASEAVSFKRYGVTQECAGCGRKLLGVKDEMALWFRGWPLPAAVFGACCWDVAAVAV